MNAYEKYYRRSYNAIKRLTEVYKNGYDEAKMQQFRAYLNTCGINRDVLYAEQANIMFTIAVALLGLNKESIEKTEKFTEYKKANNALNIRKRDIPISAQREIAAFDAKRVRETDLDDWLSIIIDIPADKTNADHIKRVRNGLLHGNFYVDGDNHLLQKAHIKTKSYYESELLSIEFQTFVFEYFSNLENLGLAEKMQSFLMDTENHIVDELDLTTRLIEMSIVELSYDNLKTVGVDTPELLYVDSLDERYKVDLASFVKKMTETNNYENFKSSIRHLNTNEIAKTFVFITKKIGEDFYKFDIDKQCGIITSHLQFAINPKKDISNWLMHFWYLFSTMYNGRFHIEYFRGDDFAFESCLSALAILKAYLVMYRMQVKDFTEIEYDKINFDRSFLKNKLISSHTTTPPTEDYFEASFLKERSKDLVSSDDVIWNKIICEVVRNSLAHGNVRPYTDNSLESMIELTDVDPKNGSIRAIQMPLEKFEEFLNSEAFSPSNCYKKTDESLSLSRKKS
ncbi:MAG: hypothetical protein IJN03_00050 [Bacilli bacterium]|nr:hypothetical protein [Bacilli bacterium]